MEARTGLGPEAIAPILAELKAGLQAVYGPRLREVILFGSYARGEAQPDSDIDVAVVLDDYQSTFEEVEATDPVAGTLSLENDVLISLLFVRDGDWDRAWQPAHANIRREGVPL